MISNGDYMGNNIIISDSGPIIHLDEVEANFVWKIISTIQNNVFILQN